MTITRPSEAKTTEPSEIIEGISSQNSRDWGYTDAAQNLAAPSSETNEGPDRIAINCTVRGFKGTRAINCTSSSAHIGLSTPVRNYLHQSLAAATQRAYRSDIDHYVAWGGIIPSAPETVAEYLAGLAETHTAATISRRLASLAKAHRAIGVTDPCKAEIVKSTMRGIRRLIGTAQREAKPILREDLFSILERMGADPKAIRDRALLLLGFAGAFRRSELVGLDVIDIEHVRQGIVLTLRRSKTDQTGAGRKIGIPHGRTRWCPVKHLTDWLDRAQIEDGPIFRPVDRHGHVAEQRLSGEAVSIIVKERAEAAGFDPDAYSGHSLRAGLATSAVIAGVSTLSIRRTTGHASDAMLARYVRVGDMFTDNAAGAVL